MNQNNVGTALITGASAGIGETFARRLASEGYNLILVARRMEVLEVVGRKLTDEYGIGVTLVSADLALDAGISVVEERIRSADNIRPVWHPKSLPISTASSLPWVER